MKKTYFILDDDQHAISRLEYLLLKYNNFIKSGSETSPEKAICYILSQRPDILFIDIEMPGYSGFDVLKRIKKDNYEPHVIFVTGYEKYAIKAIKKAAFDYLLKPVDNTELELTINRLSLYDNKKIPFNTDLLFSLTPREKEVFEYLRYGLTSTTIALNLNISRETVNTHRRKIINKLGFKSTKEILIHFPIIDSQLS